MYTRVAIILLICSVVVASLLHQGIAAKKDTALDRFTATTRGVHEFISARSNILFDNQTHSVDLFTYTRYAFAPAYTSTHEQFDTVLTIAPKDWAIPLGENRKTLWQATDTLYRYTLTCSR